MCLYGYHYFDDLACWMHCFISCIQNRRISLQAERCHKCLIQVKKYSTTIIIITNLSYFPQDTALSLSMETREIAIP